ncbi:MAG: DNA polymerase III subunit delta' [Acidobacteriota bacterium]
MLVRSLAELRGNRGLLDRLRRTLLPPAAIFSGPEGVGKRTAAILLAAKANCSNPEAEDLCGSCSGCRKSLELVHPDLLCFPQGEGASLGIDEMRTLRREAQFRPFEGKNRFFIVDGAERLTVEAQNCLLKTLEEPPPTSHIVLVTATPEALLPTIRSRCCLFRFSPLSRSDVAELIRQQPDLEEPEWRVAFSQGSIGRALELDPQQLRNECEVLLQLLEAWARREGWTAVIRTCDAPPLSSLLRRKEETHRLIEILQTLCYDLYLLLERNDTPELLHPELGKRLRQVARHVDLPRVAALLDETSRARRDLERNLGPQICFETLWLRAEGDLPKTG